MAKPRHRGQRETIGREATRDRERVADRARLTWGQGVGDHAGAKPGDLMLLEELALRIDDEAAQHVGVAIRWVALVTKPRAGDPVPRAIDQLELDPGILDVEHATREAMAGQQVADHDIELDAGAADDRDRLGRQVPRGVPHDATACHIDRRDPSQLGLGQRQLRVIVAHRRHPGMATDEAMRCDAALLGAELTRVDGDARHVAIDAGLWGDLIDPADPVAGVRRALPRTSVVNAHHVGWQAEVRRQEAAMTTDA
jgi:hypothetical protein